MVAKTVVMQECTNNLTLDLVASCGDRDAVLTLSDYEKYEDKIKKFMSQDKFSFTGKNSPDEIADVPVFRFTSDNGNPST